MGGEGARGSPDHSQESQTILFTDLSAEREWIPGSWGGGDIVRGEILMGVCGQSKSGVRGGRETSFQG